MRSAGPRANFAAHRSCVFPLSTVFRRPVGKEPLKQPARQQGCCARVPRQDFVEAFLGNCLFVSSQAFRPQRGRSSRCYGVFKTASSFKDRNGGHGKWTDTMEPAFRPASPGPAWFLFSAHIQLPDRGLVKTAIDSAHGRAESAKSFSALQPVPQRFPLGHNIEYTERSVAKI